MKTTIKPEEYARIRREVLERASSLMSIDRKLLENADIMLGYVEKDDGENVKVYLFNAEGKRMTRVVDSSVLREYDPSIREGSFISLVTYWKGESQEGGFMELEQPALAGAGGRR